MNGMILQHSTCPQCGILRTVRVGYTGLSLCMNCRSQWPSSSIPSRPLAAAQVEELHSTYPFTPAELTRLEIYRRAIGAGLYTDSLA